jgi:imidazolonepropionase-like amidohydrolase
MVMAKQWTVALGFVVFMFVGIHSSGQAQTLVIEGGTLIDGTGRNPVQNAVVVIEGNRFKAIGTKGQVTYPPNAKVINAAGKTILPGLFDTHTHYADWQPPIWLKYGFTTVYALGSETKWIVAQKEAQKKGLFQGPRMFVSGSIMDGPVWNMRPDRRVGVKTWPNGDSVATPEEAAADVRKHAEEGVDFIKHYEAITPELWKAMAAEAHKHGVKIGGHSENAREAVMSGMDVVVHMNSVERALMPHHAAELKLMREFDFSRYWPSPAGHFQYWMEPNEYDSLIQLLVSRNIPINPTIAHSWWVWGTAIPHSKDWANEIIEFAKTNAASLGFVPDKVRQGWLDSLDARKRVPARRAIGDQDNAVHPTDLEGYQREREFLQKFVKAGGKLIAGADNSSNMTPGLCTNQEMEALVFAGVPPMQVIQAVTKWPSEAWKPEIAKDLGSVEVGKLADLITVNGDPLKDIRVMRNVEVVIQDGKVLDTKFDPNWKNPLPGGGGGE